MRWTCRGCPTAGLVRSPGYDPHNWAGLTFGGWLMHRVDHSGHWIGIDLFKLVRLGIIDAEREGGDMFWRWDFWNAKQKAW